MSGNPQLGVRQAPQRVESVTEVIGPDGSRRWTRSVTISYNSANEPIVNA